MTISTNSTSRWPADPLAEVTPASLLDISAPAFQLPLKPVPPVQVLRRLQ